MQPSKLIMALIGCKPTGRNTEQHDVFFTIATQIKDIVEEVYTFWPEAHQTMHLDAWRAVTQAGSYAVDILPRQQVPVASGAKLFFINLGGYRRGEFEEYHYKLLVAAADKKRAITEAKKTAFFNHNCFNGAPAHVDDRFGIDVDDLYEITDILPPAIKEKYQIVLTLSQTRPPDNLNLGYMPPEKL